jgi:hypothetical protein
MYQSSDSTNPEKKPISNQPVREELVELRGRASTPAIIL